MDGRRVLISALLFFPRCISTKITSRGFSGGLLGGVVQNVSRRRSADVGNILKLVFGFFQRKYYDTERLACVFIGRHCSTVFLSTSC